MNSQKSIEEQIISINSPFESYWGVFLEFGCNLHCDYCIQKISSQIPTYNRVKGTEWVKALNSIEGRTKKRFLRTNKVKKLAIIGGEPSLHPDFIYILNNLDNQYSITVTTNLSSPLFKDINLFINLLKRKKRLRFHISYHPSSNIAVGEFINKIKAIKRANIDVNRLFMVAYPPNELDFIKECKEKFISQGLSLEIQRFMGFYNGKLYPNKDAQGIDFEFEDNINDFELYNKACSMQNIQKIQCKIFKVLFAPDGTIYNCHSRIYVKSSGNYGNIFRDKVINLPQDYFLCDSFGCCNPCDFGQAKFKES